MKDGSRASDKGRDARAAIAAAQRAERRAHRGTNQVADWSNADGDKIVRLVSAATFAGSLITFGYTRDQGAYMVGFYSDGDRYSEYCRPTEDLGAFLDMLIADYQE